MQSAAGQRVNQMSCQFSLSLSASVLRQLKLSLTNVTIVTTLLLLINELFYNYLHILHTSVSYNKLVSYSSDIIIKISEDNFLTNRPSIKARGI